MLVALASLVLGMGLPVTAAYIVLATLSAPALYNLIAEAQLVAVAGRRHRSARGGHGHDDARRAGHARRCSASPWPTAEAQAILDALRAIDPSLVTGLYDQLLTPALLTAILLSAHMIIFWLSQDSNVTPPVCLTALPPPRSPAPRRSAPASPPGSWPRACTSCRCCSPTRLCCYGDWPVALNIFAFALVGLYAFAAAFQGHLETDHGWPMRLLLGVLAVAMLYPNLDLAHWTGLAIFAAVFVWDWRRHRRPSSAAV